MRFSKKMLQRSRVTHLGLISIGIACVSTCFGIFNAKEEIEMEGINVNLMVDLHQSSMMSSIHRDRSVKHEEKEEDSEADGDEEDKSVAVKNPYSEWRSWCEPIAYQSCEDDAECADVKHPSKRVLKCIHPWWAGDDEYKVCAAGFSRKSERMWRYDRLREIVRQNYFDETKHCKDDGRPIHKENWRCQAEWKKGERLANFLWIVYIRETGARPWKRHRLEADASANETSWYRQSNRYGWSIDADKSGDVQNVKKISEHANYYYPKMHRWKYGLGPYGHNAALFTAMWDIYAPPEILCREVESTEVYLRRARKVVRDLANGIDCDGDRKFDHWDKNPTLAVIHRGSSGGKMCPKKAESGIKREDDFRKRASRANLDADAVWTMDMLGRPMDIETENIQAELIYERLEQRYPSPS